MMDYSKYEAEILEKLRPLGEPERVAYAKNDKKSQLEFLAIRVPVMQKAVREGFSFYDRSPEEILAIWNAIWFSSAYYEVMSAALIYYEMQLPRISPALWPTLSTWSQRVENWAHCDGLAHIYSYMLAQDFDEVYPVLQKWNDSDNQWLRRLSLVSLIHYSGKKAVFLPLDKVLPMLANCLSDTRPYVQKAIGWVLRETAYVYYDEIVAFIELHLGSMGSIAFAAATERFPREKRAELLARRKALRQLKTRMERKAI
ncbi:MAG TPA: DNA alkylation repair protein [Ktedonobacteraceae bacterium]|jgi:3-methyladenine DNA glycosylase AlkD|nr:DNA alkylation repair protein [Ktedonobacteraceae bacterium]